MRILVICCEVSSLIATWRWSTTCSARKYPRWFCCSNCLPCPAIQTTSSALHGGAAPPVMICASAPFPLFFPGLVCRYSTAGGNSHVMPDYSSPTARNAGTTTSLVPDYGTPLVYSVPVSNQICCVPCTVCRVPRTVCRVHHRAAVRSLAA